MERREFLKIGGLLILLAIITVHISGCEELALSANNEGGRNNGYELTTEFPEGSNTILIVGEKEYNFGQNERDRLIHFLIHKTGSGRDSYDIQKTVLSLQEAISKAGLDTRVKLTPSVWVEDSAIVVQETDKNGAIKLFSPSSRDFVSNTDIGDEYYTNGYRELHGGDIVSSRLADGRLRVIISQKGFDSFMRVGSLNEDEFKKIFGIDELIIIDTTYISSPPDGVQNSTEHVDVLLTPALPDGSHNIVLQDKFILFDNEKGQEAEFNMDTSNIPNYLLTLERFQNEVLSNDKYSYPFDYDKLRLINYINQIKETLNILNNLKLNIVQDSKTVYWYPTNSGQYNYQLRVFPNNVEIIHSNNEIFIFAGLYFDASRMDIELINEEEPAAAVANFQKYLLEIYQRQFPGKKINISLIPFRENGGGFGCRAIHYNPSAKSN